MAHEEGMRMMEKLRKGVEQAINLLGSGFLEQPANQDLREKLQSGRLKPQDYYRQLLCLVYRVIILFVAEERNVLFHPDADEEAREYYNNSYSMARLWR